MIPQPELEEREALFDSLTKEASRYLTICEQLRFIFDYLHDRGQDDPELVKMLLVAFQMGKKMNSRLAHYKRLHGDKSGSGGSKLLKLEGVRSRAYSRSQR